MKKILFFLIIITHTSLKVFCQEEDLDLFISKFNIGQSMATIGQYYKLNNGLYNSDEDYISFVIPANENRVFGVDVKGVCLYFKKDKLFKFAFMVDRSKAVDIVLNMSVKFSKYAHKTNRDNEYYKGILANLYTMQLDDDYQLVCISNNKIVPIDFEFK